MAKLEPWSIRLEVNLGNYDDGPGVKLLSLDQPITLTVASAWSDGGIKLALGCMEFNR